MNTRTSRLERVRPFSAEAAAVAGALAIALSLAGQLFAARIYARDVNAGHPMGYQSTLDMVSLVPSMLVAMVTIGIAGFALGARNGSRDLALLAIGLAGVVVVLSITGVPGDLAARHWIEPYPGGR